MRPSREHALAAERKRRAALLPPNAACERCGTTDTLYLDADLAQILCADCAAKAYDRDDAERHHPGGRRWDIVMDLTPNWHRVVSALQRMRKGANNSDMSELLYGIGDLIYAIADYLAKGECEAST
jgi:hypothetical protein